MRMNWEHLAFAHWRVKPEVMRRLVPEVLEMDLFDGTAWIGVVPFEMTGVRAHGLPGIPPTNRFLELNLRTYVVKNGRPGVFFFSLDAECWLAVRGARLGFHLPYFDADMDMSIGDDIAYRSRRTHRGAKDGSLRAIYQPVDGPFLSKPGSLEHWLTERYCLYSARTDGALFRGEVHHRQWPLQRARMEIRENSLGDLIGLELGSPPASVLFSRRVEVVAWNPVRVG